MSGDDEPGLNEWADDAFRDARYWHKRNRNLVKAYWYLALAIFCFVGGMGVMAVSQNATYAIIFGAITAACLVCFGVFLGKHLRSNS